VIYLNKSGVPGNLSYHSAANDSQLISFTNNLAGTSFTSATQCLVYYAGQTDKVCFNRDYEGIVTNGLVLNLDAGFTPSYSRSGTTWYDLSLSGNNGTLTNGPTFSSDGGGSIVFDGVDDYVNVPSPINTTTISMCCWIYLSARNAYGGFIDSYTDQWEFITDSTGEKLSFVLWKNSGGYDEYKSTDNIPTGQWSFVGCSISGTSILLTLGTKQYSYTMVQSIKTGASSIKIGASISGAPQYLNGKMATVCIYNRALTYNELMQNYNAQKGRFGL
jgi:hypothetical protein